ncbi:MAG: ATP-binding protein [Candidatus Verstraetearchaeota archaeon]|nr:ATP-binding protein [Candidatus Verstraetearchaeota archaeon]
MKYIERALLGEIRKWMDRREIIAIKGPRQSGKTTLLDMLREWLKENGTDDERVTYLSFEDRELLAKFAKDPREFIRSYLLGGDGVHYFLIDEAQYCPDLGQKLKLLYDTYRNAKFVITGSSSLELTSSTAKYLVGRLLSFELYPFSFLEYLNAKDRRIAKIFSETNLAISGLTLGKTFEVKGEDIFTGDLLKHLEEYALFGGYPEVVKAGGRAEKALLLKNIFSTYLERDIVAYLRIEDTEKFRRLVSILAFNDGNLLSYEGIIASVGTYFKDLINLLDVLQQTYVIRLLRPFHRNLVTELRKAPKVYFIDTGLRNHAINNFNEMGLRGDAGALAENFALNELIRLGVHERNVNFWRTTAKAEVDFVISDSRSPVPVEVKFQPLRGLKVTKSLASFVKAYRPPLAVVLTKETWGKRKMDGTTVEFVPLAYI